MCPLLEHLGGHDVHKTKVDVARSLWTAAGLGQKVIYEINRGGLLIYPSFYLQKRGVNLLYYYLALVGLMTLAIGVIVFLNARRPLAMPYLYFYLLSFASAAFAIFSPTGRLDVLDSVFFWVDKVAFLFFPRLLLHFFLIFPQRKRFLKTHRSAVALIYLPAGLLLLLGLLFELAFLVRLDDADLLVFQGIQEKLLTQ